MRLRVQSRRGASGRVLIVEPDDDIRRRYKHVFKREGWDVIEASDGRDALAKALVGSPSVIITETHLAFIDGYSLCEVLRRDFLTRTVPILLLTNDTQTLELQRARTCADAVLGTPITGDDVLTQVERIVRQREERGRTSNSAPRKKSANARTARFETTLPPAAPSQLRCYSCDGALKYQHSYVGGVASNAEQWDYFDCPAGCGTFQFRQRTGRLCRIEQTASTTATVW
jgi:CheY-like chemotaxis protein